MLFSSLSLNSVPITVISWFNKFSFLSFFFFWGGVRGIFFELLHSRNSHYCHLPPFLNTIESHSLCCLLSVKALVQSLTVSLFIGPFVWVPCLFWEGSRVAYERDCPDIHSYDLISVVVFYFEKFSYPLFREVF